MSHQLLKSVLYDMKEGCNDIERYKKQLEIFEKLLKQLRKDPATYKKEIKRIEHAIKFKKELLRGSKTNLKNSGKSMATIIANRHHYDLTVNQKKFWSKFNGSIMSKWDLVVPYSTCTRLRNFLTKNSIPR